MPRKVAAYLADIVEACDAIEAALAGVNLETYHTQRIIRSSVEREFILIGEAVGSILRLHPELSRGISHARIIVGFRNLLTHNYAAVDDETVYAVATADLPQLKSDCAALIRQVEEQGD